MGRSINRLEPFIKLNYEMEQRLLVAEFPGSARKVLRLAQVYDDLPGQFP